MDAGALCVIADDLTGACDVGAALLPWPGGVVVEAFPTAGAPSPGVLVRNTQSRVVSAAEARARVRAALADAPAAPLVLKKIDTALRGWLGPELEAAMDAVGAEEAFVLPAIPAVGRTTVGGVQLHGGIPVHETPFADDPWHPVRDSRVVNAVEAGTALRACSIALATVREPGRLAAAIDAARAGGARVLVCDAELDADLDRALEVLERRPRPLVLAGSIGLGGALRRRLPGAASATSSAPAAVARAALVVVGSAHPAAHAQLEQVARATPESVVLAMDERGGDRVLAARAADALAAGATVLLCVPGRARAGEQRQMLERTAAIVAAAVAGAPAQALVVVGGETAHALLEALGQPHVRVERALAPLVVGGVLLGGVLAGCRIVTKAGSAGAPDALAAALAWALGRAA